MYSRYGYRFRQKKFYLGLEDSWPRSSVMQCVSAVQRNISAIHSGNLDKVLLTDSDYAVIVIKVKIVNKL